MSTLTLSSLMVSVANCLNATSLRAVVRLRATPAIEERVAWLAERANEDQLTPDERAEYESCIQFANFVGVLQSKARCKLNAGAKRSCE